MGSLHAQYLAPQLGCGHNLSMSTRTFLVLILVIIIVTLYRPRGVWRELMRVWGRRDYLLKVVVVVLGIYFLYGLYNMYEQGMLSWEWYQ
jgi:hypothetical protein